MQIKSNNQMMFHPKITLRMPATILPSENLVMKPKTQEVTGMIAKIKLTIHAIPK